MKWLWRCRKVQMNYYKQEIQKNKEYWKTILGDEICGKIAREDDGGGQGYPDIFQKEIGKLEDLYKGLLRKEKGWNAYPSEGIFGNFFRFFGRLAVEYAGISEMINADDLKNTILLNFYRSVEWIPIRVLIREIRSCKEEGRLWGRNTHEEYQDYQERFLANNTYIEKLCRQYPEMKRLLFIRIAAITRQTRQILFRIADDSAILNHQFFPENPFREIKKIEFGLSDAHNGGQTVAKLLLDNQAMLIYKPRSLEKDICFMELYKLFCEKGGLSFQGVDILARKEFSWESYVEHRSCRSVAEVKRYFKRMGILLFLCWFMDMSDMHGENIIAAGEYPMPVDLETLPGHPEYRAYTNADQMVREELKHSVLGTGILPVITWGGDGKGIILNALNRGEMTKTPFRIPVLKEPESSEIYIDYQYGEVKLSGGLPYYSGKEINPAGYAGEILEGF